MLARIILKEMYDIVPEISRLEYRGQEITNSTDAVLLIGDKVITAKISDEFRQFEIDLAKAWQQMTGLGFVFAVWACKPQFKLADAAGEIIRDTLRYNLKRIGELAKQHAPEHNWPVETAKKYLSQNMYYNFDSGQLKALKLFYLKAHQNQLIKRHKMIKFA
jgi:chorismate dehydratase